MRQILYSILLMAGMSLSLYSCSSGDYSASNANPANGSVNPLNPLSTSQFNWPAVGMFSATINGVQWVADSAIYYLDTGGINVVMAYKNGGKEVVGLYLKNTWQGNLYNMGHMQYNTMGSYWIMDSTQKTGFDFYTSPLGNSGELYMQQNDTAHFMGRFYFQAVSATGDIKNFMNGYFNLHK